MGRSGSRVPIERIIRLSRAEANHPVGWVIQRENLVITRRFISMALNAALCATAAGMAGCNQQPAPGTTQPGSAASGTAAASSSTQAQTAAQAPPYTPPSADQLYELVAPIALFPDKLVAQVLAGSTYPDQVTAADSFLEQNQKLQGAALQDAIDPQSWDPSIKGLTVFPKVLDQMAQNIPWTTALGNAYVNDPTDVLNAIQVMRQRASKHGSLRSSSQLQVVSQPVTTAETEAETPADTYQPAYDGPSVVPAPEQTIEILPTQSDTVYVPEYDPQTVYGDDVQTYPSYRYEQPVYSTGNVVATGAIAFGAGIVVASLLDHSHHQDRPSYGWNSWGMQWHGRDEGGGDHNRGNWQRPAVVHNNNTYVSKSTTVINHYTTTNNINNSVNNSNNRRNNGNTYNRPAHAGDNHRPPPAAPAPAGANSRVAGGPAHANLPSQQPVNRPNFNGALSKGQPARFAHPGVQPGPHPGARPGAHPGTGPVPVAGQAATAPKAHVNMPGVTAPNGMKHPISRTQPAGQLAPVTAHPGSMRMPGKHVSPPAPANQPPQHTGPVVAPTHTPPHAMPAPRPQRPAGHPLPAPHPQAPVVHREAPAPHSVTVQHPQAPRPVVQQRPAAPPRVVQPQRQAPRPAAMQQRPTAPRPAAPRANTPAKKVAGHPPKKDDKSH
jgi:hypothetical protein